MAYTGRIIRKLIKPKALSVLAAVVILPGLIFLFQHTGSTRILSVNFNTDGGSNIAPRMVTSGEAVVRPGDPVKDGYEFLYWELRDEEYDFSAEVTEDITLKAIYGQDDRYEIKLDFGDHVKTFPVADGIFEKPLDPARDGYEFVYWELDGKEFDFSMPVSSDLTLVAKWEANDTGNEAYEPKTNPI